MAAARDCAMCGVVETEDKPHKPCSKCKVAYYCSVLCQKQHWKEGGHKQQCGGGDSSSSRGGSGAADASPQKKGETDPDSELRCLRALISITKLADHGTTIEDSEEMRTAFATICELADEGNSPAQYGLGAIYDTGLVVPRNISKALKHFRKAADKDHAKAQYEVGCAYANGKGVPRSDAKAIQWFRKAANQGLDKAQYNLGVLLSKGDAPDLDEAFRWIAEASKQGHAEASRMLPDILRLQSQQQQKESNKPPPIPRDCSLSASLLQWLISL